MKSNASKKVLSIMLAILMMFTAVLPASGVVAAAVKDGESSLATVEVITNPGLAIDAGDKACVKITNESVVTLEWYPADLSIGRYQDGWWVGVKINAPVSLTAEELKNVKYNTNGGAEKSFWANKDSKDDADTHFITCWVPLTAESLNKAISAGAVLKWVYAFDWQNTGLDHDVQTVTISIDPTKVVLNRDGKVVYDADTFLGSAEVITNPGLVIDDKNKTAIKITNESEVTLEWYPADQSIGRYQDGWWVGVKINAPKGLTAADLKDVHYTVNGSAERSFWANKDSKDDADAHYITCWVPVTVDYLKMFIAAGRSMNYVYRFDWKKNGTDSDVQTFTITIDPTKVVLNKNGETVFDEDFFFGSAEVITDPGLAIDDSDKASVKITNESEVTLEWYPADQSIGRYQDGWWVGVKINAPKGLTAADLKDVHYTVNGSAERSFWANKDSKDDADAHYITCWVPVTEEYLKLFAEKGYKLTYRYNFDWKKNGTDSDVQTFTITIDPTKVLLKKDGKDVHVCLPSKTVEPTCAAEGYTEYCCISCDYSYHDDFVAKTSHTPSNWIVDKDPDCLNGGTKHTECTVCHEILDTEIIPATGHKFNTVVVEPTCTAEGYTEYSCTVCDYSYRADFVAKISHTPSNWIVDKDSDCLNGGTKHTECTVCREILDTEIIPATGHKFNTFVVEPTCTAEGYTSHTCEYCGYIFYDSIVSKADHVVAVDEAREPSCTEPGLTEGTHCSICAQVLVKQEEIPATEHRYSKTYNIYASCTENGYVFRSCADCGYIELVKKTDALGHAFSSKWIIDVPSTTDHNGQKSHHCSRCTEISNVTVIPRIKSVSLSTVYYTYNGKVQTPGVIAKDTAGKTLKNGTDYTVKYASGRKAVGKYAVTVSFKGAYAGTRALVFAVCPGVPKNLTYKASSNAIALSWGKVDNATGYRVYVYNTAKKAYSIVKSTSKTSCTVKDLKPGQTYRFAVRAFSKVGNEVIFSRSFTTIDTATVPLTVSLKAAAASKSAQLRWNKVNCTGYVVYMATSSNGSFKKVAVVKGNSNISYKVTGLSKGRTYYFKVRAFTASGSGNVYGSFSTAKKVTVK